jgi:GNAT superfamily N-acetyltransferase
LSCITNKLRQYQKKKIKNILYFKPIYSLTEPFCRFIQPVLFMMVLSQRQGSERYLIEILPNEKIDEVRQFLYTTYHKADGWTPPAGDPAGLRISENKLMDDRDHLCTWMVARDATNRSLVGCLRAAPRVAGGFETQLYDMYNNVEAYEQFGVEIARFSVAPALRGTNVGLRLMEAAALWANERGLIGFAAPVEPGLKYYYSRLGYLPAVGMKPFQYFGCPLQAEVYGCNSMEAQEQFLRNVQSAIMRQGIFSAA